MRAGTLALRDRVGDLAADLHRRGRDRMEADRSATAAERQAEADTARELLAEIDRLEQLDPDAIEQMAAQRTMAEETIDLAAGGVAVVRLTQQPRAPLTDYGNAERLAEDHAESLRYVPGPAWHVWDGRRWARDEDGSAMRCAKASARLVRDEARELEDEELARKVFGHAVKSESHPRLVAALKLAESEESLIATVEELDSDPMLFNVLNGTLDLRAGELRPHDRADRITKLAAVEFDPAAKCPTFERFLAEVVPDAEVRAYLQAVLGYCLSGHTSDQAVYLPEGEGANGKSTLLEAVMGVLGDYARHADASTFTTQPRRGVRSDLARLDGARLVVATEIEDDARLAEVLIKQATGGEKIVASRLYRDEYEFAPEFKVFLAVNRLPQVRGDDHAIWRRVRRIPFPTKVERPDKQMPEKLRAERAGILAWMVRGCLRWQREGLYPPRSVRDATEDYRGRARHVDTVTRFVEERCRWAAEATAAPKAMYDAYRTFCAEHGWRAVGAPRLKEELEALGAWRDDDDRRRLWREITLAEGAP